MLIDRLCERAQRLAVSQAICQLNGVDRRLLALFWQLAERWGKVVADGVSVTLPLPHRLIAELVGARRPTVSTALGQLADRGLLTRDGETWLLHGDPVGVPTGEAARVIRGRRRRFAGRDHDIAGGAPQEGVRQTVGMMTRDIPDVQGAAGPGYSSRGRSPLRDGSRVLPPLPRPAPGRPARGAPPRARRGGRRGRAPRRRAPRRVRRRVRPRRCRPTRPGSRSRRSPSSSPSAATSRCSGSSAAGRPRAWTCARARRSRSAAPPRPGCSPRPVPAAPR